MSWALHDFERWRMQWRAATHDPLVAGVYVGVKTTQIIKVKETVCVITINRGKIL